MSRRDSMVPFRHMLDHAREAVALIKDKSRSDLTTNRLLQLGLVRLVEIVGEAAGRVPKEEQTKQPGIPWPDVVGMRNRLIHGYDTVDLDVLWDTVKEDFPPLITQLEKIIPPESSRTR